MKYKPVLFDRPVIQQKSEYAKFKTYPSSDRILEALVQNRMCSYRKNIASLIRRLQHFHYKRVLLQKTKNKIFS